MGLIAGIDLGTSNSLIGIVDSGFPVLLADEHGRRLLPSVVHFRADGEAVAGVEAARQRAVDPENTIWSVKRLMGRRGGEEDTSDLLYRVAGGKGEPVKVETRMGSRLPEEISAIILRALKALAERAMGAEVNRAVITVPAYFNDSQRSATKRAGELAGFEVKRILNEPTSAALAHGLDKLGEKSRIAVYDLGGGTFDLSILELREGVFEVLATNGNTRLGGDDIDRALAAVLRERAEQHIGRALPPVSLARLREAAREAKEALSETAEYKVSLPFLDGPRSFECVVFRGELDALAQPVVAKTRGHCIRAMADARVAAKELDAVLLVGGMTRMPLVREFAAELFGREPDTSQDPDEAVAAGATIQAGILDGALRDVLLLDVTPLSLGIETFGGLMNVIIPRNTTIPVKAGEMFTNALPNQSEVLVHVLQGERELAKDNWSLGRFSLSVPPASRGVSRVGVQFEIDENGMLHALARDTAGGQERRVDFSSAVDVSDEAVEKMIAESVEHAFDDVSRRQAIELKMKAEEMIPATRSALEFAGGSLGEDERSGVQEALERLVEAVSSENVQELKARVAALDAATQTLAAKVVEMLAEQP